MALSVSALVHLLLFVLAPLLLRRDDFRPTSILQPPEPVADNPLIISLFDAAPPPPEPTPSTESTTAPSPAPAPRAAAPDPAGTPVPFIPATPGVPGDAVVAAPVGPPSEGPEGGGTIAERLRPGPADARLWSRDPKAAEFTPAQMSQLRILWAILDMNDSLAVAEAAARRMTDWTFTDAGGGKWGISEGKIHLGDITLPLPSFSPTPGSPAAQRQWVDAQIERGAAAAAARANLNERIRAMRERIDRERRGLPPDTAPRPR